MKWIRVQHQGQTVYGRLVGQTVELTEAQWADVLTGRPPTTSTTTQPLDALTVLNPIQAPPKIICIGLNYRDHCRETGAEPPAQPIVFAKFGSALAHPHSAIRWSTALTQQVDFEAELAVVIGREARRVAVDEALGYVAGYTAANDVSARDLQFGDGQWIRGKSLDTFCPLGPVLVTADEIPDPQDLAIRCTVNGQEMQNGHTSDMIFGVAELISFCSHAFTLYRGDVILTGTPHGVGLGRTPPRWLQDGDRVVVEIERIGRLENYCQSD